jgi:5-methylcytosine-specific restriction endonuclease McrA
MVYIDYLKSSKWIGIRERKKASSKKHCLICGNKYNLQVHHRNYFNIGNEKNKDLMVLCGNCHFLLHRNFNFKTKVLSEKEFAKVRRRIRKHLARRGKLYDKRINKEEKNIILKLWSKRGS